MARRNQEFQTLRSEGGLLPPDLLRRVIDPKSTLPGLRPEDYGLPKSERINEVVTQSWNRLRKHWAEFRSALGGVTAGDAATGITNEKWTLPLLRELGFGLLPTSAGPEVSGRHYAITRFFGPVPVHLVGAGVSLDRRAAGVRGAAVTNPHGLVQEFLNRSPGHLWAIVSNGLQFRVMRDNQALSRQAFLEFDLEAMFAGEVYADFVLLWLTAHATRFASSDAERPETCWLEQWAKEADEQGTRALGDLRAGVRKALETLGTGFSDHPRNGALRELLRTGQLKPADLHGQLLRIVYRLILLFVAEDRTIDGEPLLHPRDASESAALARRRYSEHYSTERLRSLAGQIKGSRHGDLWRQFQVVSRALSADDAAAPIREQLALPVLGSFLWDPRSTAALNDADLSNFEFLEALRKLAFTHQGRVLRPVDYRNIGAEELGGVYEGLLELTPEVSPAGSGFHFVELEDNERKESGSYYTPDVLVQALLDAALDPTIDEAIKGKSGADAESALLSLKVCDPAVGSGHFLVGAAHRLAQRLARVRSHSIGDSEPSPLLHQQALRDVIGRCVYGVDLNPMAAELCRVSLWLEALEPGKPLSFLEHHIRVGNSLLGATPERITAGVPDEAFAVGDDDDRKASAALKKRNRVDHRGLGPLFAAHEAETQALLRDAASAIELMPDNRPEDIQAKENAFRQREASPEFRRKKRLADAWCAAFLFRKRFEGAGPDANAIGITQRYLNDIASDVPLPTWLEAEVQVLASRYGFFHWYLAFPWVTAEGGFDVVLGNPPWIRQELIGVPKQLLRSFTAFRTTADLSVFFTELAVRVVRAGGRVALLTPNKWFKTEYGAGLRSLLRLSTKIDLIIDFGHSRSLFPDADTFPAAMVAIVTHEPVSDEIHCRVLSVTDDVWLSGGLRQAVAAQTVVVSHGQLRDAGWTLEHAGVAAVISRLLESGIALRAAIGRDPLFGIKTGFNEAYYFDDQQRDALLASDARSRELFWPLLRGRDIGRWQCASSGMWQLVIESSENRQWPWSDASDEAEAEAQFKFHYQGAHAHVKVFEKRLRERSDQGRFWWELRSCDYYETFRERKIAAKRIAYHSAFGMDQSASLQNDSTVMLPTDDTFILAVLNSRVVWWLMAKTFPHKKDEAIAIDVNLIAALPIPNATAVQKAEIRDEVARIHQMLEQQAPCGPLLEAERRLNVLVEDAYGLSSLERTAISESLPPRDPIVVLQASCEGLEHR